MIGRVAHFWEMPLPALYPAHKVPRPRTQILHRESGRDLEGGRERGRLLCMQCAGSIIPKGHIVGEGETAFYAWEEISFRFVLQPPPPLESPCLHHRHQPPSPASSTQPPPSKNPTPMSEGIYDLSPPQLMAMGGWGGGGGERKVIVAMLLGRCVCVRMWGGGTSIRRARWINLSGDFAHSTKPQREELTRVA